MLYSLTGISTVSPDIFTSLNTTLSGMQSNLITLANTIGIIAVIACGITWMFASDPSTSKTAKKWLFNIAIALIVINGASKIVEALQTTGSNISG